MLKEKKRVILFSPINRIGGIASWTKNLLAYIEEKGIVYVKHADASLYSVSETDTRLHRRIIIAIQQTPRLLKIYWKVLREENPYIVHRTCSGSLGFYRDILFTFIAKYYGVRSVVHFRFGRIPELCEKKNWEYRAMCWVIKHSYRSIIIDSPSYKVLCKDGYSDKIVLIPNPCASDVEKLAREEVQPKESDSYIFVGHLIKTKGVCELVQAFVEIPDDLELTLIGPYEKEMKIFLEQVASKKRNGRWLRIVGSKDKSFVLSAMKVATALVFPTYTEGFPNVVLEAIACGCPVLASGVAAIPDMLNRDSPLDACGICFESRSVEEILRTMQLFRSNPLKHFLFAQNGKKKVLKEYTLDAIFPLYEKVWNE